MCIFHGSVIPVRKLIISPIEYTFDLAHPTVKSKFRVQGPGVFLKPSPSKGQGMKMKACHLARIAHILTEIETKLCWFGLRSHLYHYSPFSYVAANLTKT